MFTALRFLFVLCGVCCDSFSLYFPHRRENSIIAKNRIAKDLRKERRLQRHKCKQKLHKFAYDCFSESEERALAYHDFTLDVRE